MSDQCAYGELWWKCYNDGDINMQISKRDYFAAAALTGLLARAGGPAAGLDVHANIAAEAFLYADAMLKLSKTLMDPIELDPDELSKEEEARREKDKEKGDKP
jgi:hypothetical protein